jgi:protein SCO1/2
MNFYTMLFLLLLIPCYLSGQISGKENTDVEIGIIEKLDSNLPGDIVLVSENGDTVKTGDLFGIPTIISLVYFRCPGICTPLMDGLAEVIKRSDLKIGTDYKVVTISFNPHEGSALALQKKSNYVNVLGLEEVKEGWTFYTSDSLNIARLTTSVGFRYKRTGNDYLHPGTLIFIGEDGKITRYLNGTRFLPFELKMAVIETSKGKSGPTINKVLQYCYGYDPEGHKYVLNITRVAGVLISFVLLLLFITLTVRSVTRKKAT